jgi:acetate kinase
VTGHVLVLNVGSSSVRYSIVEPDPERVLIAGHLPDTSPPGAPGPDGAVMQALDEAISRHAELTDEPLLAVGHRVVHGGPRFHEPVLIDDDVVADIEALTALAPLHNPRCVAGITAARQAFPTTPQVAVFDTAFHHGLPPVAHTYAVPPPWRVEHHVRRYGFHGISFAYVTRRAAQLLGHPDATPNLILLHLGNGASACAVREGRSIDTSMGLSPVEGLVMGTRSGDIDPSLGPYLARVADLDAAQFERVINEDSGLKGLAGTADMVELERRRSEGDPEAMLAFDLMVYRLRKYIGGYAVALGRVDAIVFTGGVGEHSTAVRAAVLGGLGILGLELDDEANRQPSAAERRITAAHSKVAAYVIPTHEDIEIARACVQVMATLHA